MGLLSGSKRESTWSKICESNLNHHHWSAKSPDFFCLSLTCCFAIACSISTKGSQRVTKQREHQCLSAHLWKRKENNVLSDCQARTYISIFSFSLALGIVLHALYSTSALILPALSFFCSICFLEMRGFIFFLKGSCFMKVANKGQRTVYFFKKSWSGIQLFFTGLFAFSLWKINSLI